MGRLVLVLRTLTESDADAFLRAHRATTPAFPSFARGFTAELSFSDYLARLADYEQGRNLPEDHVSSTTYYGFIGSHVVGRLMLRHRLNDVLHKSGGHIGYVVVPEFRQRGIATQMLRLALPRALERDIGKLLITCDEDNTASKRVIEKCGGVLEGTSLHPETGVSQCRYWISLR